jgi:hypothetical protein
VRAPGGGRAAKRAVRVYLLADVLERVTAAAG